MQVARVTCGLKQLYQAIEKKKKQEGTKTPSALTPALLAHRYKIIQVLGEGRFSIIYEVVDTFQPPNQDVTSLRAVKVMKINDFNTLAVAVGLNSKLTVLGKASLYASREIGPKKYQSQYSSIPRNDTTQRKSVPRIRKNGWKFFSENQNS
jgi:hypothetical protein